MIWTYKTLEALPYSWRLLRSLCLYLHFGLRLLYLYVAVWSTATFVTCISSCVPYVTFTTTAKVLDSLFYRRQGFRLLHMRSWETEWHLSPSSYALASIYQGPRFSLSVSIVAIISSRPGHPASDISDTTLWTWAENWFIVDTTPSLLQVITFGYFIYLVFSTSSLFLLPHLPLHKQKVVLFHLDSRVNSMRGFLHSSPCRNRFYCSSRFLHSGNHGICRKVSGVWGWALTAI